VSQQVAADRAFLLELFTDYLALEAGHSVNTVESYLRDLRRFVAWVAARGASGPGQVTRKLVREFVFALKDLGLSASTIRRHVSAIRTYYGFLLAEAGTSRGFGLYDENRAQQGSGHADGYARLRHRSLVSVLNLLQPASGVGSVGAFEREPEQGFDVLAIDAFSGDSIPMHLLTREAMLAYMRHLKPDGVIVFQATNRFVDIAPVVERLAAEFGLTAVLVSDAAESNEGADYWISGTDQIIVTRNAQLLAEEPIQSVAQPLTPRPDLRVWTDDFYNLMRILKY